MHITDLHIQNFRGIQNLAVKDMQPTVLLNGPNGSGKTTALDALRFALLGKVRDQSGAPLKLEQLVGPWGDKAVVEFTVIHGAKRLDVCAKTNGKDTTITSTPPLLGKINEQRAGIWTYFGLDDTTGNLALDPLALLYGNDLLGELTAGTGIAEDDLRSVFGDQEDRAFEVLGQYRLRIESSDDLTAATAALREIRTKLNRQIKALNGYLDTTGDVTQPSGKKGLLNASHKPQLDKLIEATISKIAGLETKISRSARGRDQEEIDAELKTLQADLAKMKEPKVQALPKGPCERPEDVVFEFTRIGKQIEELDAELAGLGETECPCCHRPYDQEVVEQISAKRDKLDTDINALKAKRNKMAPMMDSIKTWHAKLAAVEDENAALVDTFKENKKALEAKIERVSAEQPAKEDPALITERDTQKQELDRLSEIRRALDLWIEVDAKKQELADFTSQSEFLTWMITLLENPATASKLGGEHGTEFVDGCNELLELFGYQIRINWDGKAVEMCRLDDDYWRPVATCSAGEVTLVQLVIADIYGGEALALIDRFEGVDAKHAANAWDLLQCPVGGRIIAQTSADPVEFDGNVTSVWMG